MIFTELSREGVLKHRPLKDFERAFADCIPGKYHFDIDSHFACR